jgi:hypothetical protein
MISGGALAAANPMRCRIVGAMSTYDYQPRQGQQNNPYVIKIRKSDENVPYNLSFAFPVLNNVIHQIELNKLLLWSGCGELNQITLRKQGSANSTNRIT